MLRSIKDIVENKIVIEKSEFITFLYPVNSIEKIKEILKDVRKEFYDATHVVYAYVLNNDAHSTDDGEPKGTAGIPTLEVLRKNDLTNILAITIRYFGGIKLGAGGLVRAYSNSISSALSLATFTLKRTIISFSLIFNYKNISFVDKKLRNALEVNKKFDENVEYQITMLNDDYSKLIDDLSPLGINYMIKDEILEEIFI
ncbi:MAG: YigZ family protein [Gammaproteobacteria bacterium]|nr:YigZ family protein [Gammaproteobacteria bacterium]